MTQTSKCCRPPAFARLIEPRFFKALSDPNRIALLVRLARCRRPCSVSELNACCPVDLSVVSRHLAVLRDAGLLEARRRGKEVFYSVQCDRIVTTLRRIADAVEACCPRGRK
ncbi:MAG: ArsR family transcriptional regulator [Phycisphaerales bacterium]|nr:MAG: ArsR family transcriptional regulator [Phycisphaerales bacterium]